MAEFPRLNSGGRVQYPVRKGQGSIYADANFWGGGLQVFQRRKTTPLSWTIDYVGLSEDEASVLTGFCERHIAENVFFSFKDPVTGLMHDQCAVVLDSIVATCSDVNSYTFRATLVEIEE